MPCFLRWFVPCVSWWMHKHAVVSQHVMLFVHVIKSLYLPHLLSLCDHLFWWLLHTLDYCWLETLCSHLSLRHENHKVTFGLPSLSLAIWALVQGRPDCSTGWWGALMGPHLGPLWLYSCRELLSMATIASHLPLHYPLVSAWRDNLDLLLQWPMKFPVSACPLSASLWAACESKHPEPVLAQSSPAGQCRPRPPGSLLAREPEGDTLYLLWDPTPGFTGLNFGGKTCKGTYLVKCCSLARCWI